MDLLENNPHSSYLSITCNVYIYIKKTSKHFNLYLSIRLYNELGTLNDRFTDNHIIYRIVSG